MENLLLDTALIFAWVFIFQVYSAHKFIITKVKFFLKNFHLITILICYK